MCTAVKLSCAFSRSLNQYTSSGCLRESCHGKCGCLYSLNTDVSLSVFCTLLSVFVLAIRCKWYAVDSGLLDLFKERLRESFYPLKRHFLVTCFCGTLQQSCPITAVWVTIRCYSRGGYLQTWLILPVVICLSQRLSHACLSISFYTAKLRMAH